MRNNLASAMFAVSMWQRIGAVLAVAWLAASPAWGAAPGAPAPPFALADDAGTTVSLAALRGRVVYVDFWASWCTPCRLSFPWMGEMQRKYGAQGFTVVAVNVDKRKEDAARFLALTPGAFTIVYDPSGAVPAAYDVKGMPTSYLVDRRGTIVSVDTGFRDDAKAGLEARIRAVVEAR
ncbi:Thiol-disulfide oxidoreductase ResA [Burkholderiales bacterium]|nr:Thiol-disulfide oxidoreductase ResA [Burkholderiales bacterium]